MRANERRRGTTPRSLRAFCVCAQALEFSNTFSVVSNRRAESQGLPPQQPYVEFAPAVSSWQVASLNLGEPRPGALGGDDWAYFRVFVSAFSAVLSVKAWTRAPGLEITLAIRRGLRPTQATFIARADAPGPDGAYAVSVAAPVTGAFYYIGVRRFPSRPPNVGSPRLGGARRITREARCRSSRECARWTPRSSSSSQTLSTASRCGRRSSSCSPISSASTHCRSAPPPL